MRSNRKYLIFYDKSNTVDYKLQVIVEPFLLINCHDVFTDISSIDFDGWNDMDMYILTYQLHKLVVILN